MYFLYFIPAGGTLDQPLLDGCGLNYLPANKMVSRGIMANGPEGLAGVIIADGRLNTGVLYYRPAEQKWEKSLNGKFWVGYWLDNPPTEKSLRRDAILDGHAVELLEGQPFTIPVARCFPAGTKLPQSIRLTQTGELETTVLTKYEGFCARAERLWHVFAGQVGLADKPDYGFTQKEQWELAVEALCLNYLISHDEVNLMGLMTTETFTAAALAIIDEPTFRKLLDKLKVAEDVKKKPESMSGEASDLNSGGEG